MNRSRRSVKVKPIIKDSSDSEDEVPLKKLCKTSKNKIEKKVEAENLSSSSESDIENYLQPIDKLDLSSAFFNTEKKRETGFNKIEKEIFTGVSRLSDSSDNEELEDVTKIPEASSSQDTEHLPNISTTNIAFKQLEDYTRNIENAKKQIEEYNAKKSNDFSLDVTNLLAAGESKQFTLENLKEEDLHSSDFQSTDDDWEEVKVKEQTETKEKTTIPKDGLQITVGAMPEHCKKKKGVDLLAAMKRRLNRIRKENQVYVHKVHLLCWIAHGNFLNSVLNDMELLALGLSLLPSDKCYPSERTDLGYLEQIVRWYKKAVLLTEKTAPKEFELFNLIKLQICRKEVYDKKMYVLIFIIILRALGIQCRLVMSLQVEPLRPPANELHSLSNDKSSEGKTSTKSIMEKKSRHRRSEVQDKQMKVKSEKNTIRKIQDQSISATNKTEKNDLSNIVKSEELTEKNKISSENEPKKRVNTSRSTRSSKTLSSEPKNKEVKKVIKDSLSVDEKKSSSKNNPDATKSDNKKTRSKSSSNVNTSKKGNNLTVDDERRSRSKSSSEASSKMSDDKNSKLTGNVVAAKKVQQKKETAKTDSVPQLDGANDSFSFTDITDIDQVDGANDEKRKKNTSQKPNLRKLKAVENPRSSRSIVKPDDSDSESCFSPSPPKKSKKNSSNLSNLKTTAPKRPSRNAPNLSKLKTAVGSSTKNQLNVKNDIINLIKGRIAEQKHVDRSKLVRKAIKKKTPLEDSASDSDYMPEPIKKKHHDSDSDMEYFVPKPKVKKRINMKKDGTKIISSDSDLDVSGKHKKKGMNVWVEVFLESEEKWISADVTRGQVHCINEIYSRATHPVAYILAWNNDHTLKDVTRRYCKNFNTITRKLRVDENWWEKSLKPFKGKVTARDKEEDDDLNRQQLDQPLPTAISEYKNHPLYALRRHLLKFEDIYPPDIIPIGYVRKEAVYPRNCVYVCKSRDIWLKDARVVKPGEKPYKIVKARPKYDKLSNKTITDQLLEIFGPWQTTEYEPPTAENGVVPRNAFGNVELFKPCMLPKGTVHLNLPGLNKICRKLNIDCASAIVGFDFHGGWSHPTYDGFVICEEFKDKVIAAWEVEQEEIEKRENEKLEKRVYGNWKKLIKGLFIRERLKARYDFGGESSMNERKKSTKKPRIQSDSESD